MDHTIAAISTPNGAGGMGVIRISGKDSLEVAESVFRSVSGKKLKEMKGYTAAFGTIEDDGEVIDEAVALVFRAPHSYTGENVVELSCHGGMYITRRVLRAVRGRLLCHLALRPVQARSEASLRQQGQARSA